MAEVEELLEGVPVRLAPAQAVRARGERRRARQRLGGAAVVVVAAVAVGVGSWAAQSPPRDTPPAATRTENPFVVGGVVRLLPANSVAYFKTRAWTADAVTSDSAGLPSVGLDGVCGGTVGADPAAGQQFARTYTGKGGARARHRIAEYADSGLAQDAIRGMDHRLAQCGVRQTGEGGGDRPWVQYAGTTGDGTQLRVSLERAGAWVSVVEIQFAARS
ncbi:hypothetical protein ACFWVC_06650 [Streptomyces sp. NPDC058691]|uniref:hypothetical protein n=1 Tax=Streptomyces sp. NPDC058691 TaxID=3346601 RepID=UPI0036512193